MMKTIRNNLRLGIRAGAFALAALILAVITYPVVFKGNAQENLLRNEPPFDFNDDFYRKNGIDPSKIFQRVGTSDPARNGHWVFDTPPTDRSKNNVRITQITGGWDQNGNLIYYTVPGFLTREDVFFDDPRTPDFNEAAEARKFLEGDPSKGIEPFRVFLFPKQRNADGSFNFNPSLSIGLPNRRQDNIFETKDRYFCENLLGLWQANLVVFTPAGINAWLNTGDPNHGLLQSIANSNGASLDGIVVLRQNPIGGAPPFARWVI
jgi:hypothetical protein